VKIVRPASQRLNSQLPGYSKVYIDSLKSNIIQHHLLKRLYNTHTGGYSTEETARKVSIINEGGKAYMRCAEKICRKIKCCWIPFSPEASIWIRCIQVYYSLICFHKGKIKKSGSLKQAAQRCNIPDPLSLSIPEITICLEACKEKCAFYQEHGRRFCLKHLNKAQNCIGSRIQWGIQQDQHKYPKGSAA
jgi:hypothetical protein